MRHYTEYTTIFSLPLQNHRHRLLLFILLLHHLHQLPPRLRKLRLKEPVHQRQKQKGVESIPLRVLPLQGGLQRPQKLRPREPMYQMQRLKAAGFILLLALLPQGKLQRRKGRQAVSNLPQELPQPEKMPRGKGSMMVLNPRLARPLQEKPRNRRGKERQTELNLQLTLFRLERRLKEKERGNQMVSNLLLVQPQLEKLLRLRQKGKGQRVRPRLQRLNYPLLLRQQRCILRKLEVGLCMTTSRVDVCMLRMEGETCDH